MVAFFPLVDLPGEIFSLATDIMLFGGLLVESESVTLELDSHELDVFGQSVVFSEQVVVLLEDQVVFDFEVFGLPQTDTCAAELILQE